MDKKKRAKLASYFGFGKAKADDKNTLPAIVLIFGSLLIAIVIENLIRVPDYYLSIIITGLFMFIAGVSLRLVAQHQLGKQFSLTVRILKDHKMITTGLYHYVRHPMYTGFGLMTLGLCLMMHSYSAMIIALVSLPIAGFYRVKFEEEVLTKKLGKNYIGYMRRTKRFIPFIW
ncbi:MAG: isoprenylcysteine carboxylmethyltransferase family protein [Candidatus Woesearchaeota archaeon]